MISSLSDLSILSGGEGYRVLANCTSIWLGTDSALGDLQGRMRDSAGLNGTIYWTMEWSGKYWKYWKYSIDFNFLLDCFLWGEDNCFVYVRSTLGAQCLPLCFNTPMQSRPL
jgi:hypothetical protein